jgi:hypothetical protein
MNVFQAEIGRNERFMADRNLDCRTVVPNADDSSRPASTQAYAAYEGFFRKRQGNLIISDILSASLERKRPVTPKPDSGQPTPCLIHFTSCSDCVLLRANQNRMAHNLNLCYGLGKASRAIQVEYLRGMLIFGNLFVD